jgi:hypothetical protein
LQTPLSLFHKLDCNPYQKIVAFTKKQNAIIFPIQNQMQTLPMSTLRLDRERHFIFLFGFEEMFEQNWFHFG